MRNIRFFFEDDLNDEYNIWDLLYLKYNNIANFLSK